MRVKRCGQRETIFASSAIQHVSRRSSTRFPSRVTSCSARKGTSATSVSTVTLARVGVDDADAESESDAASDAAADESDETSTLNQGGPPLTPHHDCNPPAFNSHVSSLKTVSIAWPYASARSRVSYI